MEGERIPDSWVGQRIDLVALDSDPSKHVVVSGAVIYSLGVRHVQGVLLNAVTDRGIVVEATGPDTGGILLFHPWAGVLRIALSK
jgi:hypothetical protein